MSNHYVVLTGSKNNAGDYLIKYKAKKLFKEFRQDREIVDLNAWEPITDEKLDVINDSKALILLGGPALQENTYPGIYALTNNLSDITAPITTMGIGWKSVEGNWDNTYNYPLNDTTLKLLQKIKNGGLTSSVRDYHTLNSLAFKGFDNYLMTGCPAYYELGYIGEGFKLPEKINKVAFSLGVSFIDNPKMEALVKQQILRTKEHYSSADYEVVFHHSLDPKKYFKSHGARKKQNERHLEFADWLGKNKISYVDISGNAENLVNYYSKVDIHIGYRVHAHIFMNSIARLSLLITEDGRSKGSKSAIGGLVVDGYRGFRGDFVSKVLNRLFHSYNRYLPNANSIDEIPMVLDNEIRSNGQRCKSSHDTISHNFEVMKSYLKSLP